MSKLLLRLLSLSTVSIFEVFKFAVLVKVKFNICCTEITTERLPQPYNVFIYLVCILMYTSTLNRPYVFFRENDRPNIQTSLAEVNRR